MRYQGSVNLQLAARVCVPSRHGCKSLFSHASTLLDRPTRACGSREVPVQLDDAGCGAASAGSDWASARQHQHRQRQLTCDSDATMQATCKHSPPGRKLPPAACPNRPSASSLHTVHEQQRCRATQYTPIARCTAGDHSARARRRVTQGLLFFP